MLRFITYTHFVRTIKVTQKHLSYAGVQLPHKLPHKRQLASPARLVTDVCNNLFRFVNNGARFRQDTSKFVVQNFIPYKHIYE